MFQNAPFRSWPCPIALEPALPKNSFAKTGPKPLELPGFSYETGSLPHPVPSPNSCTRPPNVTDLSAHLVQFTSADYTVAAGEPRLLYGLALGAPGVVESARQFTTEYILTHWAKSG